MKEKKYGISLLRMLMCFEVILLHLWTDNKYPFFLLGFAALRYYSVGVFIIISFYLTYRKLSIGEITYLSNRIKRLVIPLIGWALIYYFIYYVFSYFINREVLPISNLFWQLFTGHSKNLNPSMWYQTVLIVLTIVFFIIFKYLSQKMALYVLILVAFLSLFLQYSSLNYSFFGELRYELKYPLGRICEMLPYAVIGVFLCKYDIYDKIRHRVLAVFFSALLLCALLLLTKKLPDRDDFSYSGLIPVLIAISCVNIAIIIPINEIFSSGIISIIDKTTDYTMGIYCVHRMIGKFLFILLKKLGFRSGTFFSCLLVYMISYLLCALIDKIPSKTAKYLIK